MFCFRWFLFCALGGFTFCVLGGFFLGGKGELKDDGGGFDKKEEEIVC